MAEGQPGPGGPGRAEFGLGPGGALAGETPACLVLGNFDGVHLGHQAILARARVVAQAREAEVVAITFQPHPRTVIQPGQGPPLISPPELRRRLLVEHRVDRVWVLPFTPRLRQLTPGEFMDRVRVRLRLVAMVVGPRVSLGRGGEGGMDFLAAYADAVGLELVVVDALVRAGRDLSSSWIRSELELGDLEQVAGMLGRPFDVLGRIERGQGLGRQLGFPTANLELHPEQALPPDGVYVMTARLDGGPELGAVGSIGTRPHFGGGRRVFEVHLLAEAAELYGRWLRVRVLELIRGQRRFASDQDLVSQMGRDRDLARARLAGREPVA